MMQQNTLLESYLRQLKLPTFAQNYAAIASDAARTGLSCERYLLARGFAELAQRDTNRVERCIAQAKLPVLKELSQFDWSCVQGGSKTRVFELAQGGYITHTEPILMIGNPGLGKTHVAAGLALAACRQGRRVRFYNVATLVTDLIVAQHELKLSRLLATLGKQELLLLDEFGFIPFSREGAHLLFQLCSLRPTYYRSVSSTAPIHSGDGAPPPAPGPGVSPAAHAQQARRDLRGHPTPLWGHAASAAA